MGPITFRDKFSQLPFSGQCRFTEQKRDVIEQRVQDPDGTVDFCQLGRQFEAESHRRQVHPPVTQVLGQVAPQTEDETGVGVIFDAVFHVEGFVVDVLVGTLEF